MEGVFSRGDRRSADLLEASYKAGARLDGWQEHLSNDAWSSAFASTGMDSSFYNQRHRSEDEIFPWDHIDIGVKREWLWDDWKDALEGGFVPDCSDDPCYDCGVCDHKVVHNRIYASPDPNEEPRHRDRQRLRGSVDYRKEDPQFVAMPRPPGRKANNVVDAVPSQGLAPGSAIARAASLQSSERPEVSRGVPRPPTVDSDDPADLCDTRLPAEQRMKLEIRYGKRGQLRFLGHLEVVKVFRRALRRLAAPVIWSRGFRPSARLGFGPALPSGFGSTSEFAELEVKRPVAIEDFVARLQAEMPEDLPVLAVREVPINGDAVAARISRFSYQIDAPAEKAPEALELVERFLSAEAVPFEVTRKGKNRTVDMRPVVRALRSCGEGSWQVEVATDGPGARIRDVLRAVWGDDAAKAVGGWSATRIQTDFRDEAGA
jgi:radical SAM-linked protein